jgi:hypothetical protein
VRKLLKIWGMIGIKKIAKLPSMAKYFSGDM